MAKPGVKLTDGHILVGDTSNQAADVAMTGDVTIADTGATTIKTNVALAGSPTTTTQSAGDNSTKIATTAYVDTLADGEIRVGNSSNVVTPVTMSGDVTMDDTGATTIKSSVALAGSPTTTTQSPGDNSTKIATTAYIDTTVSALTAGLDSRPSCRVATTAALTATYSNGSSGVGATLTNSGTQAALSIDGVSLAVNDRVLVKKPGNGRSERNLYGDKCWLRLHELGTYPCHRFRHSLRYWCSRGSVYLHRGRYNTFRYTLDRNRAGAVHNRHDRNNVYSASGHECKINTLDITT